MTGIAVFFYCNDYLTVKTTGASPPHYGRRGRACYQVAASLVGIAATYLMYIILSNQFQYAYVFGYSSRDLPLFYKLSAFWAGQEGSFMLWLVFHVLFGLIMLRGRAASPATMVIYGLIQSGLLILLLAKSPFMLLAEPKAEGNGLNPLLQDPWMVIHPPLVFLGYAGFAVPFAYALGGLLDKRYDRWIHKAMPWVFFAWAALGAGMFVGGYWAYKVLGWGGYWAWDPVENSSLVPWLTAGALVHLLVLARVRPVAVKPAYFAVIFTYLLVLYGTFLTRSGILSDFSTHSFADEGVGGLLTLFIIVTFVAAFFLLIVRWSSLPIGAIYSHLKSREFILACTALVFAVLAAIVFIGMSTPLFTKLLGNPQSVSTSFYNTTSLPLALVMAMLLAASPVICWGENTFRTAKQYRWLAIVVTSVFALILWAGIHQPVMAIILSFSVAAFMVNIAMIFGFKKISRPAGLTHAGVAAMLIGIIVSSTAGTTIMVGFEPQESKEVFGKKITYEGIGQAQDGKGFYHKFSLEDNGTHLVQPFTKLNKEGRDAAREPGIYRSLTADIYMAPVHKHEDNPAKEIVFRKGEQAAAEGLDITLVRLSMAGRGGNEGIRVQALFEVSKDGKKAEITPEMVYRPNQVTGNTVKVFDQYEVMLGGVNPSTQEVLLGIRNLSTVDKTGNIDVEISKKPLINLVWLGAALVTLGTLWAVVLRVWATKLGATELERTSIKAH